MAVVVGTIVSKRKLFVNRTRNDHEYLVLATGCDQDMRDAREEFFEFCDRNEIVINQFENILTFDWFILDDHLDTIFNLVYNKWIIDEGEVISIMNRFIR